MAKRLLIGITLRLAVVVVVFMFLRSDCFQNLRLLFSVLFFLYLLPQKLKSSTWKTFPLIEKSCSVSYNCFKKILQEKIDKYNAGKRGIFPRLLRYRIHVIQPANTISHVFIVVKYGHTDCGSTLSTTDVHHFSFTALCPLSAATTISIIVVLQTNPFDL